MRRFLILVAVAALAALQSSSVVAETGSPGIGASIPIRAGVHTYVHSVALNPAFCAKLEAAVPNMRGQPCLGTITVRVTSGAAVKGRTLTTNTALAPVEVYAEWRRALLLLPRRCVLGRRVQGVHLGAMGSLV